MGNGDLKVIEDISVYYRLYFKDRPRAPSSAGERRRGAAQVGASAVRVRLTSLPVGGGAGAAGRGSMQTSRRSVRPVLADRPDASDRSQSFHQDYVTGTVARSTLSRGPRTVTAFRVSDMEPQSATHDEASKHDTNLAFFFHTYVINKIE